MIQGNTTLDILVNGNRIDILDRSSINLRINNVIYNPTEITNKQAEYSFSFNLPTTPNNNKIFDYANVLSKPNKFNNVYSAEVYVDGILIFEGSLRIQSIKKGFYNVNLVNIKINTVEDIFGEMKMSDISWKVPFTGVNDINVYNADKDSKVIFPLVCYGAFQKSPSSEDQGYNIYTSKFQIDKTNRWYYESFNPSPNLLEVVKKAFEQKGYSAVGDIFQDEIMKNIYMSVNISDKQKPIYNLGYPTLGRATIGCEFSNYLNKNTGAERRAGSISHNLSFPYQRMGSRGNEYFNWESVEIYDLWSDTNSSIIKDNQQFLFDDNCIVIPADGLYKIKMSVNITLPTQSVTAQEWWVESRQNPDPQLKEFELQNSLKTDMPVEIQLVKNEDECELIHGAHQFYWNNGDRADMIEWNTAYPHENLYSSSNPTTSTAQYGGTIYDRNGRTGGRVDSSTRASSSVNRRPAGGPSFYGYMPKDGELLAYDPWVNPNFIMGISTLSGGTPSIIKNGYSWNKSSATKNNGRYNCVGYWSVSREDRTSSIEWKQTDFNSNVLKDSPLNACSLQDLTCTGSVAGIVELKRNDVLILKAITKQLKGSRNPYYKFDVNVDVQIEAYSPYNIDTIDYQDRGWESPTQFDVDLNLGQFMNSETNVSDFINNFLKEFNLSYLNVGNMVYLNKQQLDLGQAKYALNLDDRVDIGESKTIEYPNSMEVKYKIDTDEWGFETTVPEDKINLPNWKDFGDYGSDKVIISGEGNAEEVQLNTSYCWYDEFTIVTDDSSNKIKIPVISKFSYMIDGYDYEESMKVDGKGLPLRYWFRGENTGNKVLVNNNYSVNIYDTKNEYNGFELSYHLNKSSILNKYFNVKPNLSGNYLSISCFINSQEYLLLKNGANVIFDSDVYIVSEIQGYDAMGINPTELLLIKKE